MKMKPGLKFMALISSDHADPKRKPVNHIIDEFYRTILVVFDIYLECSNSRGFINCRKLSCHETGLYNGAFLPQYKAAAYKTHLLYSSLLCQKILSP